METTFQPHPQPGFPPPAVPETSSTGRTLKTIWRVLVGLQCTAAAAGLAIGILIAAASAKDGGEWSGLGEVIGTVLAVVSGLALAWFAMMMFASFQSNVVAATMGIIQGLVYVVPAAASLGGSGGFGASVTPLIIGGGWIWLCATYRKWPAT